MTVWFINRFFYPDGSATSQLLTELATDLADAFQVSVVTSAMCSNEPEVRLPAREALSQVQIHRLNSTRFGRATLLRKALDLLSFQLAVIWFVIRNVGNSDIVVLKTDPPLLSLVTTMALRIKRAKIINWIQDIYPEIAIRLGKFPGPAFLANGVCWWRDRALWAAQSNVVVSDSMANYLGSRGLTNVRIFPNWADENRLFPVAASNNSLRSKWQLEGKFVVMYSGNFGRVHSFEEIEMAVLLLASEPHIHFVFVGDGPQCSRLKASIQEAGAANVSFKPYQPIENLCQSLGLADLHLVSLKPGMEDLVAPSKIYGVLAVGRPVAFVGERAGIAQWIEKEAIGIAIASGGGQDLAEQIQKLAGNTEKQREYRENARNVFENRYTRALAVTRWKNLLLTVGEA